MYAQRRCQTVYCWNKTSDAAQTGVLSFGALAYKDLWTLAELTISLLNSSCIQFFDHCWVHTPIHARARMHESSCLPLILRNNRCNNQLLRFKVVTLLSSKTHILTGCKIRTILNFYSTWFYKPYVDYTRPSPVKVNNGVIISISTLMLWLLERSLLHNACFIGLYLIYWLFLYVKLQVQIWLQPLFNRDN